MRKIDRQERGTERQRHNRDREIQIDGTDTNKYSLSIGSLSISIVRIVSTKHMLIEYDSGYKTITEIRIILSMDALL